MKGLLSTRTVSLVERKVKHTFIGDKIGRGIGKVPRLSYDCKKERPTHSNCTMLSCSCSCHDKYRIKIR